LAQSEHTSGPDAPVAPRGERGSDFEVIDLTRILETLSRRRWLVAGITLAVTVLGLAYAFLATPIYQANALLQIERKQGGQVPSSEDFNMMAGFMGGTAPVAAELEILTSRSVLMPVIDELRLNIVAQPARFPLIGDFLARGHTEDAPAEAPLALTSYGWGGEEIAVHHLEVPEAWLGENLRLRVKSEDGYGLYGPDGARLGEGRVGEKRVFTIPQGAQAGAGGEISIAVARLTARPGTEFRLARRPKLAAFKALSNRLSAAESGVDTGIVRLSFDHRDPEQAQTILEKIVETYLEKNVQRNSAQAQEQLNFISEQIPQIRSDLRESERELANYRAEEGVVDVSSQAEGLIEQYAEMEARLSELTLQKQNVQKQYTSEHPRLEALNQQIAELRSDLENLDQRLNSLPESEREFVQLQRDVQVGNELYVQLLSKMQELRVMKAGEIGNVRIIDEPVRPAAPIKPKKGLIGLVSLLLGSILGVGSVFAKEAFYGSINDPDELERELGVPVYAVIPHSTWQDKLRARRRKRRHGQGEETPTALLGSAAPDDIALEALRSLRTALQFALLDASNNIVALTGPQQGVGKSFIASNLALVTAQVDKRVLLIDADMRRGELHRSFAMAREPGLSQAITGQLDWREVVRSTGFANFDLLTTGVLPPNPSELLMSEAFASGLNDLAQDYDLVLIDTPATLPVADSLIIGRSCGTVFLVLKAGQHSMREVEHTLSRLAKNGIRSHGFIFNDLPRGGVGAYSYYHYSYG